MSISIGYGKIMKIAKYLSQLGVKTHKNRKLSISISYGKMQKIAKCLSQLGILKKNVKKSSNLIIKQV